MTPKRHSSKGAPWTIKELRQLGKVPDSVMAGRTGRTIKEVVAERDAHRLRAETAPRRWTANEIKLLGKLNDYELARRFRRARYEVRWQRVALKIPPSVPRRPWRVWKPKEIRLLGTMPD